MSKPMNRVLKAIFLTGSVLLASGQASAADKVSQEHLDSVKRDIKLMSSILNTSLKDKLGRKAPHVEGTYLAHQGILFELESSDRFSPQVFVSKYLGVFSDDPTVTIAPPPPPPKPGKEGASSADEDIERVIEIRMDGEDSDELIEMNHEGAAEMEHEMHRASVLAHAMKGFSNSEHHEVRIENRELREKQRELSKRANKVEREVRQVERKIRDAEMASELGNGSADKKLSELEKEMAELSKVLSGVNNEMAAHRKEVRATAEKAKRELIKKQKEIAKTYAHTISELVCDFGSGLKSLRQDKYLSFYINDSSKLYYVFAKDDVVACTKGRIKAKELLNRGNIYSL